MKHTVFLLVTLWATQALSAQPPQITGAFGFKLGEKFDTSKAIKEIKLPGGPAYEVEPINPHRACSVYRIRITSKTHQIYTIFGEGRFTDVEDAVKEALLVMELLKRKYGENEYIVDYKSFNEFRHTFAIGSRRVYIFIDEEENGYGFRIIYTDKNLSYQAYNEQLEIDLAEIDPSGF